MNHAILQDNYCHLVAPSVTSQEAAVAMISNPGVDSYAIVEQVMNGHTCIFIKIVVIMMNFRKHLWKQSCRKISYCKFQVSFPWTTMLPYQGIFLSQWWRWIWWRWQWYWRWWQWQRSRWQCWCWGWWWLHWFPALARGTARAGQQVCQGETSGQVVIVIIIIFVVTKLIKISAWGNLYTATNDNYNYN